MSDRRVDRAGLRHRRRVAAIPRDAVVPAIGAPHAIAGSASLGETGLAHATPNDVPPQPSMLVSGVQSLNACDRRAAEQRRAGRPGEALRAHQVGVAVVGPIAGARVRPRAVAAARQVVDVAHASGGPGGGLVKLSIVVTLHAASNTRTGLHISAT